MKMPWPFGNLGLKALSLGIVKPPTDADIVSMEAQSFGVPLGFGGPQIHEDERWGHDCPLVEAVRPNIRTHVPGRAS